MADTAEFVTTHHLVYDDPMPFQVPPLTQGCPWYDLSELGRPNIKWCEANQCSWIVAPADTWSNVAYLLVAIYLLAFISKNDSKISPNSPLRYFPAAAAIVGVTSFIHHMSYSVILQILDHFGMYVFTFLIITLNLRRMGKLEASQLKAFLVKAVIGMTAFTIFMERFHFPIQSFVLILILAIIATEISASSIEKKKSVPYSPRYFFAALGVLLTGAVCSFLDASGRWCAPDNHWIQGHAFWHMLSALSLAVLFHHYRQFRELS